MLAGVISMNEWCTAQCLAFIVRLLSAHIESATLEEDMADRKACSKWVRLQHALHSVLACSPFVVTLLLLLCRLS
jgi:hypothetical protein